MDEAEIDKDLQDLLRKHFPKAASTDTQLQLKSTTEIFAIVDEHVPERWTASMVAHVLDRSRYERKLVGNELRWLVVGA